MVEDAGAKWGVVRVRIVARVMRCLVGMGAPVDGVTELTGRVPARSANAA